MYVMDTYSRSHTHLSCEGWKSDEFTPLCGVKQGDPLSPVIFNMVIDRLLKILPPEIGVRIGEERFSAFAFANDLIFVASTASGLQQMITTAADFLAQYGLVINATKSFTVAIRNVPHLKKSIVDNKAIFTCLGQALPAISRESQSRSHLRPKDVPPLSLKSTSRWRWIN